MFDYRMKALQKALNDVESSIDIKETGGASFSFLDKETERNHHDYIELLSRFFERMMNGEFPLSKVEETVVTLISIFTEEDEEVSEVCDTLGELDALKSNWNSQTKTIVEQLRRSVSLYRKEKQEELPECFELIEQNLKERMPNYSVYQSAFLRYQETLTEEELLDALDREEYDEQELLD